MVGPSRILRLYFLLKNPAVLDLERLVHWGRSGVGEQAWYSLLSGCRCCVWLVLAPHLMLFIYLFIYLFICLFSLFRAVPVAYRGSLARGLIGTVAAGLYHSHSNARSEPCLRPIHHSSRQRQILNPLSKARDQTHNLIVPSQIC